MPKVIKFTALAILSEIGILNDGIPTLFLTQSIMLENILPIFSIIGAVKSPIALNIFLIFSSPNIPNVIKSNNAPRPVIIASPRSPVSLYFSNPAIIPLNIPINNPAIAAAGNIAANAPTAKIATNAPARTFTIVPRNPAMPPPSSLSLSASLSAIASPVTCMGDPPSSEASLSSCCLK